MPKPIITASAAANLIKNDWTITTGGFGSCGHPEALTIAIKDAFFSLKQPSQLTLLFSAGQGDKGTRGLNQLAHEGLIKRVIGGYWALTPQLTKMVKDNLIEAYNLPQGVISHLFRVIASGKPGLISPVGIATSIDPRYGGGKMNNKTKEDKVELITVNGMEQLFYHSHRIDCALLRGSFADEDGNISMQYEANLQDNLVQAQAAKSSGGIVIVQVLDVLPRGSLSIQDIRIPGVFVDYVVIAHPDNHWQTYAVQFDESFTGRKQNKVYHRTKATPMNEKKIIARRAYLEILKYKNPIINLGIGLPEYISEIALEEKNDNFTLTVESGAIGGYPAGGMSFGASYHPVAFLEQASQFDFYDGGGLDIAFLSFGEVDSYGNVNINRLGASINGVGGFINISQATKRIVFCGTFTTKGLEIDVNQGRLHIVKEGAVRKFVKDVVEINFNASIIEPHKKHITYITERGVFELINGNLVLTEIAAGIDIQKDILNKSDAKIIVSENITEMNKEIFFESKPYHSFYKKGDKNEYSI